MNTASSAKMRTYSQKANLSYTGDRYLQSTCGCKSLAGTAEVTTSKPPTVTDDSKAHEPKSVAEEGVGSKDAKSNGKATWSMAKQPTTRRTSEGHCVARRH